MHSQETTLVCEVDGCSNTAFTKSNYCYGHSALRRWLRKGKSLESFISSHSHSNLHHGKPLCKVEGCFHRAYKKQSGIDGTYCSYHFDVVYGHPRTVPQSVLTDYSLPISLANRCRGYTAPKVCCVKGCTKKRHILEITRDDGGKCISKYCKEHYEQAIATHPLFYTPGECCIDGCSNPRESKGLYRGKRRYSRYCSGHRRHLRKIPKPNPKPKAQLNTGLCSRCGWMGPCDKHRLVAGKDGGRYIRANVIVVCPNCHRLLHRGLSTDNQQYFRKRTLLGIGS